MTRLCSTAAFIAACAAATPALAHMEAQMPTGQPPFVPLDQAMHDLAAAAQDWPLARALAERNTAVPASALLADDMQEAVRLGDEALRSVDAGLLDDRRDLDDGWRSARIEAVVQRVWACTAHIVNAQPPTSSGA